jgi:hypothetical protein
MRTTDNKEYPGYSSACWDKFMVKCTRLSFTNQAQSRLYVMFSFFFSNIINCFIKKKSNCRKRKSGIQPSIQCLCVLSRVNQTQVIIYVRPNLIRKLDRA